MIVTRKPQSFASSLPSLLLNNHPLEAVTSYKYLGVILTANLSWSSHIQATCSKTRRLLGMIYRKFYRHSSTDALIKLYIALILPHLQYCASVWDPAPSSINAKKLEDVQNFALRLCTKRWSADYHSLLDQIQLPTLFSQTFTSQTYPNL